MLVYHELKYGIVGKESGYDVEGCEFQIDSNAAVRQLMTRNDWWSNVAAVECCVRMDGVLVWPRGVSTILALNVCGYPTEVQNRWYRFRPMDTEHYQWGLDYQRRGYRGELVTSTNGTTPVFNQILSPGFTIRTFIRQPSDVGKTITYYGLDQNGQIIRSVRPDGTWQDGIVVTLANPHVDTPIQIQRVTRVLKDETNDVIDAYQYNVAQGFLLDLGHYQPSERNPEYIVTKLTGRRGAHHTQGISGFANGCCPKLVTALVKLNFIPFKYDNDLVQIDNQDAIRDMIKSVRKKGQGDITGAADYESSAIHELNRELETKMPEDQIVFENRTFGGAIPHRRLY